MSETTNSAEIKITADATGVEAELRKVDEASARTDKSLSNLGRNTGMEKLGEGAAASTGRFVSGTKSLIDAIERRTQTLELGKKGTVEYFEALANAKGVNPSVLKPYLDQLEAVTRKTAEAAEAQSRLDSGDSFLEGLRAQASEIGKTNAELLEMRAAQLGVTDAAKPMIDQLREAEEATGGLSGAFGVSKEALIGFAAGIAGAFSFGALISGVNGAIGALGDLDDMAQKTGSSVETLSRLQKVAAVVGQDFGAVDGAIAKVAKGMAGLDEDSNKVNAALKRLGISSKDAAGDLRDPSEVLIEAANNLQDYADGAGKTALINDLLGKSGADLLPYLNDVSEKIGDFSGASAAAAAAAGEMQNGLGLLRVKADEFYSSIATAVVPAMSDLVGSFADVAKSQDDLFTSEAETWADNLAIGLARVADVALLLPRIISSVAGSFKVVLADAALAKTVIENATVNPAMAGQSLANIKRALAERNAVLEEANTKYQKLWNDPANQIEQSMLKRLADRTNQFKDAFGDLFMGKVENYGKKTIDGGNPDSGAKDRANAIAKEADAYRSLTEAINERIAATAREAAGLPPLTDSQKLQADLNRDLLSGVLKLTPARKAAYEAQIKELGVQEQVSAAAKKARQAGEDWAKMAKAQSDAAEKSVEDAVKQAEANELLAATFGMTKGAIEALALARLEDQLAQRSSNALTLDEIDTLEKLIEAKKRSAAALGSLDAQAESKRANDAMNAEWKKAVDQYDEVFREGFAGMLNDGKDGWKSFTQSLVTTFKTSVADQIYKMFAQPFVMKLVASLVGTTGGSTLTTAAQALGGSGGSNIFGNATSLLSAGKTLYTGFASGLAGGVGSLASSIGTTFGSTTLAGFGGGLSAAAGGGTSAAAMAASAATSGNLAAGASTGIGAAGAIPIVGWIAAGMALSNNLYKKGWDADNGSISKTGPLAPFNAPMLQLNTLLQKIGLSNSTANMLSGASTVSRLFGRKNPEVTDQGIEGTFGNADFLGKTFANILEKGGVFRSDKRYTKSEAVSGETDSTFDETFKSLLTSVKGFGEVMGIEAGQIDAYTKQIKLTLGADAAKNDEMIAGVFGDIGNDLAKLLIPSIEALSEKGETAAATLQRIATGYLVMDEALAAMGDSFGAVGIDSLAARERLLELSGGLEAFSKGAAFFAQNYLTEAQRTEALTKQVTAAFADLGLAVPKTRAEFASLVLGTKKFTEEGAKTYAGLTNIQEAFAALTPELAKAAEAIDYSKELRQQEIQIMDLTGDKAGALAAARKLELEGLDATLQPNQLRINKLKDEAAALVTSNTLRDEAVARNNSILSLQAQIYQVTGDKAGAAAVLQKQHIAALAAADPALRSYIETLYAVENAAKTIQGKKDTAAGLVTGVDDAFAVLQRIAATEKARATEAHNLAMTRLQESIDAESTAIATRKAQAATAIASTKALSDTIRSTLSQMSIEGNEAGDRASAQAQVRAALAIARAGGPLPAADGIKDALSTLANISADQFASMEDFLRAAYGDKSDVSALGALADSTLSVQEQTLKVMEEQKSTLAQQKEAALLAYQGEVSRLDSIVVGAQQQIDVLKGIDTTGLSIVQGLEAVRLAIVQAAANPIAGAAAPINDAYKESLGRAPDAAGLEYWKNAVASGSSTETVVSQIANSMEAQIQGLYKSLLGRSADAAGLAYFIKTGSSIGQIYQNITDSDEYKRRLQTLQAPIPSVTSPPDRGGQAFAYGSQSSSSERTTALLEQLITTVSEGNASTERLATMFDDVTEGGNGMRADIIATV